jgi:hypothetical protein
MEYSSRCAILDQASIQDDVPCVGIAEAASKSTTAAENIAQAPAPLRLLYMVCLLNSREAASVKKA